MNALALIVFDLSCITRFAALIFGADAMAMVSIGVVALPHPRGIVGSTSISSQLNLISKCIAGFQDGE